MVTNNLTLEDMDINLNNKKSFNDKYINLQSTNDNQLYILDILTKAKAGDEDCILALIKKFEPLVKKYSLAYSLKNYELADFIQSGNVTIISAINKYNLSRGMQFFDLYMINAIKNTYKKLARDNVRYKSESSLNIPADDAFNDIIDLIVDDFNIEDDIVYKLENETLKSIISILPTEDKLLIKISYLTPETNLYKYCKENNLNYPSKRRQLLKLLDNIRKEM